ncbi:DUF4129 domain-containing protein [Marinicellulosiphila megalodicopiae]|uniref:DUF4129 domain-containing protein n=1 Tax=Marinicellulosiphila megalodicopiae TaxID=2724896 RepID=UPI003BB0A30F
MLKSKDFTSNSFIKAVHVSLFIILIILFLDTSVRHIKFNSIISFDSGAIQAVIVIVAFLVIKKMIAIKGLKSTIIIIISTILAINIFVAAINFIPKKELRERKENETLTFTETQTEITVEEIVQEQNVKKKIKEQPNDGPTNNSISIILKYSWILNFIVLAIISYGLFYYARSKNKSFIIIETATEEPSDIQEIKIEEITAKTYEQGVYHIYRQLCEIAKNRNGITRKKSMTPTEYGELLIKLDFPKIDILNIIEAFEALRYGDIQISDDHIHTLNCALKNINQAIKQHD